MLFPLSSRTAYLKLTTSHYYLPSGRCIHREENSTEWGVDPDLTIEMTPEQMRAAIDARQDLDVRDADATAATARDEQAPGKGQGHQTQSPRPQGPSGQRPAIRGTALVANGAAAQL